MRTGYLKKEKLSSGSFFWPAGFFRYLRECDDAVDPVPDPGPDEIVF